MQQILYEEDQGDEELAALAFEPAWRESLAARQTVWMVLVGKRSNSCDTPWLQGTAWVSRNPLVFPAGLYTRETAITGRSQ